MVKPLKSPSREELTGWTFDRLFRHLELSAEVAFSIALIACALAITACIIAIVAIGWG